MALFINPENEIATKAHILDLETRINKLENRIVKLITDHQENEVNERMQKGNVKREYYSIREFARKVCKSNSTIHQMVLEGKIAATQPNGPKCSWFIPKEELDKFHPKNI